MAKAKTEKAVESKEVSIKADVEVVVTPSAPLTFITNFTEIKSDLKKKLSKYKGMKVTDANFDKCKLVQKECVSLRTLLENKRKEAVKMYIELPKNTLNATFEDLLKVVAEVEDNIKTQMDVYDEETRNELKVILTGYIEEFQAEFALDPKYLDAVVLHKHYFNKTQKEADTREEIKAQFTAQKVIQEGYYSDVKLIRSMCADNKALNPDHLVKQLEYRSASAIVQDIIDEKERLAKVDLTPPKVMPVVSSARGAPMVTKTVTITMPKTAEAEVASVLKSLLKIKGVTVK